MKERVVVYDGTNIQFRNPVVDNFWGKEGCNELLVPSRPDIIKDIHASFLRLTSGFLLEPEQSTSAIVVHHPGAKDFVV